MIARMAAGDPRLAPLVWGVGRDSATRSSPPRWVELASCGTRCI